ncbi:hypothetical protein TNCV_2617341 [Trichonephila clavipes]|nr:hypothetical protein TNCV_2617341 [Trichonephila clavipes]
MEVTRVEQRAYIKIAVLRGRNSMECHGELVEVLGGIIPYSTVARWLHEGFLATDLVILNHGQVMRTTPELEGAEKLYQSPRS